MLKLNAPQTDKLFYKIKNTYRLSGNAIVGCVSALVVYGEEQTTENFQPKIKIANTAKKLAAFMVFQNIKNFRQGI